MYFQQIYRFEVDLLKKFALSFPPEQFRPWEISAGRYEFGWGASPDATTSKGPTKHNFATATISPADVKINSMELVCFLHVQCFQGGPCRKSGFGEKIGPCLKHLR